MSGMLQRRFTAIIWWIVGGGLLVRLYRLTAESAWTDELWAVERAESGVVRAIESQASRCDPDWVYDCLLHFWIRMWGNSEYSTRLLSVLFGTMAVYGIYKVGETLFDHRTGIAASVMLSLSVLHVDFSQQVRMYTLSSCLTLVSYYCFVRLLARGPASCYFGWFAATALSFYTQLLCALAVGAQSIYLALRRKQVPASVLDRFLLLHIGLLLALNPCVYVILGSSSLLGKARTYLGAWDRPTFHDVVDVFIEFAGSVPLLILLACLVALAVCGVFLARHHKEPAETRQAAVAAKCLDERDSVLLVALWLAVPLLLLFSLAFIVPSFHGLWRTRYLYSASLAFLLLIARVYCMVRIPWLKAGVAVLFLLLSFAALLQHDRVLNRQQIRQACDFVTEHVSVGDEIVIYPDHYRSHVAPYYLKARGVTLQSLPELRPGERTGFQYRWQTILRDQRRTWLLCFLDQDESRDRDLELALAKARETAASGWRVVTDKSYVSFTRVLRKPYAGAHVMLLEPDREFTHSSANGSSN